MQSASSLHGGDGTKNHPCRLRATGYGNDGLLCGLAGRGRKTATTPMGANVLDSDRLAWAEATARKLMQRHGLSTWTFRFNKSRTYTGLCLDRPIARIELSAFFVSMNPQEKVVGTILHEIAHGLCGVFMGHNSVWRAKCLEIGGDPEVVVDANMPRIGKWAATCLGCRRVYYRRKSPASHLTYHCQTCGRVLGRLYFSQRSCT